MINETALSAFIVGSFTLASIFLTWFLKNRRSIRKISAEEFIENFMKSQAEAIAHKDQLLAARDENIRSLEIAVKKWTQKAYKYETVVKELKVLIKKLKEENRIEKKENAALKAQHKAMEQQVINLKGANEKMYAQNFIDSQKRNAEAGNNVR